MGLHDILGNAQAQTCASEFTRGRPVNLLERLEDLLEVLLGDADAGVNHSDQHMLAISL
jgi:hypothetical protein